jgi:hypothetical protein
MTTRRAELLVGLALALAGLAGASWQVDASQAQPGEAPKSLPRLVCPLH